MYIYIYAYVRIHLSSLTNFFTVKLIWKTTQFFFRYGKKKKKSLANNEITNKHWHENFLKMTLRT